jgi:hypothetical protein
MLAETAKPSIAELSKDGSERSARTGQASTLPAALDTDTSSELGAGIKADNASRYLSGTSADAFAQPPRSAAATDLNARVRMMPLLYGVGKIVRPQVLFTVSAPAR